MDLGSGIACGSLCVAGGAVAITAIKTFSVKQTDCINGKDGINGINGINGKNGAEGIFPCKEHSGVVKAMETHERWLIEIAADVKQLLRQTK
jgi:hypothetical protein